MAAEPMALSTAIAIDDAPRVSGWPSMAAGRTGARSKAPAATILYEACKRVFDVIVAATLLLMLLPLFAIIGLAIVHESGRPIFYRGERVGRYAQPFRVVKFRSMIAGCDQAAHAAFLRSVMKGETSCRVYKVPSDSRVTRVGAFLRRTSLDELPQLWNVLRGEMSLVGPRPDPAYALTDYEAWMQGRLIVRPGITGLWQVSGRSRLSPLEMYRLDVAYAAQASPLLDLRILLCTIPVVLGRNGAA
jgi:lipopolysaccharide/colanic/teichoic acid biosynthesis glycosyltransferase